MQRVTIFEPSERGDAVATLAWWLAERPCARVVSHSGDAQKIIVVVEVGGSEKPPALAKRTVRDDFHAILLSNIVLAMGAKLIGVGPAPSGGGSVVFGMVVVPESSKWYVLFIYDSDAQLVDIDAAYAKELETPR